jgi:hypothetical protein
MVARRLDGAGSIGWVPYTSIQKWFILRKAVLKLGNLEDGIESLRRLRSAGAVRNAVGIRCGAFSGNMKVSFQAARSIG